MECIAVTLSVLLCRQSTSYGLITSVVELNKPLPSATQTLDVCRNLQRSECEELWAMVDKLEQQGTSYVHDRKEQPTR